MKDELKITNLKEMLLKTKKLYGERIAYKIKIEKDKYKTITHNEVRDNIDGLGTALIDMGLKDKRIGVIGPNRYEWEISYLSVVCGVGVVVPFDKSLPPNELVSVIERSEVEAIFFSEGYKEILEAIKFLGIGKLKHLISMDLEIHNQGIYSQRELIEKGKELIKQGNKEYINAEIDSEAMNIMLFTSGTTSKSKIVALSHRNLCSNLIDISRSLEVDENDVFLSVLPLHHVFECTVGMLFSLYRGAQTCFSDGLRHISENLKEYNVTFFACVPAIYEGMYKILLKNIEKQGKLEQFLEDEQKYKNLSLDEKKKNFQYVHDIFGGKIRYFISGAAALDPNIEIKFRNIGFNMAQGYGLTETSPVIGVETIENNRIGSIGKALPSIEAKVVDCNIEGIGELVVKGPNVMIEYYGDKKATKEVLQDGWFYTGDLATIDEDGFIFIRGRKKSVIVLKNGKNIFPEEMENLVNKIEGVKESLIFGKQVSDDANDLKINVKIIFDRDVVKNAYKVETDEEIYDVLWKKIKELNQTMPKYKAIRGVIFSEEPLIKTSTNKIKRQANIDEIEKSAN